MRYEQYKNENWVVQPDQLDSHPDVKGHDFTGKQTLQEFLSSFSTTGMQASNLGHAINVVKQMRDEDAKIVLAFTGNAISSGLRDIITYLVKEKKVHALITSGAGIEEDIIKSNHSFKVGRFDIPGKVLFDRGIGRIGNILVPLDRYTYLEQFLRPFFEQFKETAITPSKFCKVVGEKLNKSSFLYWAAKNDIPVFSPGLIDGSLGDLAYFSKRNNKNFTFDFLADTQTLVDYGLNNEKLGAIILGGGMSKHYALNSMIFRDGFDYAVYLTTAEESDGSDSGGNPEEAITWAKIKLNAPYAKVKADFTITFPMLIAGMDN